MEITQNISLDFGRSSMPPTVFAKQGDNDTRKLVITPLNNGEAYTIGNGITARFHMTKPDKHVVIDNATISSGKIEFTLTGQCLAAHGTGVAEIGLYNNDELLTTQIFYIEIEKSAYDQDAPESTDELNSLADYVRKERKIAGVDLQDDITAGELKNALSVPTKTSDLTNDSGFVTNNNLTPKMDKVYAADNSTAAAAVPTGQLFTYQGRLCCKTATGYDQIASLGDIVKTLPVKNSLSDLSDLETNQLFIFDGYILRKTSSGLGYKYLDEVEVIPSNDTITSIDPKYKGQLVLYRDELYVATGVHTGDFEKIPFDSAKENVSNKVTSISSSSTDTQYPSAKAVYDALPAVPTNISDLTNDAGYVPIYNAQSAPPSSATSTVYPVPCLWVYYDDNLDVTRAWFVYARSEVTVPGSSSQYYYSFIEIDQSDVTGKENASNKVTSLSSSSTDTQYPSAKCVYDLIGDIESALAALL